MSKWSKRAVVALLCVACLMLAGCSGNVGVGMSVGVPVGNNGHVSVSGQDVTLELGNNTTLLLQDTADDLALLSDSFVF